MEGSQKSCREDGVGFTGVTWRVGWGSQESHLEDGMGGSQESCLEDGVGVSGVMPGGWNVSGGSQESCLEDGVGGISGVMSGVGPQELCLED